MTTDTPIPTSDDAEVISDDAEVIENGEPLKGYELVADMMRRQDEVIAQIDALNDRIESAIKDLDDARKLEQQAGEASDAKPKQASSQTKAA